MKKREKCITVALPNRARYYIFNGVIYSVESRFQKQSEATVRTRFKRILENNFSAHLTDSGDNDKIRAEYVLDTVGEEDHADQNKTK